MYYADTVNLACSANLPTGLYILWMFFSLFFIFFYGRLSNTCFSESNGLIFSKILGLVEGWNGLLTSFSLLWSLKGCCHGNQLNLWDVRRHSQERPLLFAVAFDNGSNDHEAAFKRLNGSTLVAILCRYLVNFRPINSEFTLLKCAIFATFRPQFDDNFHLSPWRSETDWKIAILILRE